MATHYAASLMNFFSNDTRLLKFDVDTISVTTQYWISLKRLMKTSRFDVIWLAGDEKKANDVEGNVLISLELFRRHERKNQETMDNFFNYIKFAFLFFPLCLSDETFNFSFSTFHPKADMLEPSEGDLLCLMMRIFHCTNL